MTLPVDSSKVQIPTEPPGPGEPVGVGVGMGVGVGVGVDVGVGVGVDVGVGVGVGVGVEEGVPPGPNSYAPRSQMPSAPRLLPSGSVASSLPTLASPAAVAIKSRKLLPA